ncbi:Cys/Met metabolism PLP-dependent enzyme-domain-containing protein [Gautieria morchelliformis]|nr:Cys/Met metabolism PLP-dependent enzyme-domain-containing protein [Gautieria morchelliformis]
MSKVAAQLQGLEVTFLDFDMTSDDDVVAAVPCVDRDTYEPHIAPHIPQIMALIRRAFPAATQALILVDSTFLSPFCISPLAGPTHADVVLHSLTKYINGHSDVLMGAIIFPKAQSSDSDALYQKLLFIQNAHGAVPGAFDAWLAMRGAKMLALQMLSYVVATHQLYYWKHSPYSLRLPSPCTLELQMHEQFAMHNAMVLLLYSLRFAYANLGSQQLALGSLF